MNVYIGTSGTLKNAYIGEYIPSSGLLGYRPLQSNLNDESGNGKNASWYSGTGIFSTNAGKTGARVTWTTVGSSGHKISTQYVNTGLTYQQTPITVCGWICYNTSPSSSTTWTGLMSSSTASGNGWTVGTRKSDNDYPVAAFGTPIRIANSAPSTNTWYFWAATCNGSTTKTYFNGALANTSSITLGTIGGVWKLGCAMVDIEQSVNNGTDGWIRHCAVYNRALTDAEILEYYNNTK